MSHLAYAAREGVTTVIVETTVTTNGDGRAIAALSNTLPPEKTVSHIQTRFMLRSQACDDDEDAGCTGTAYIVVDKAADAGPSLPFLAIATSSGFMPPMPSATPSIQSRYAILAQGSVNTGAVSISNGAIGTTRSTEATAELAWSAPVSYDGPRGIPTTSGLQRTALYALFVSLPGVKVLTSSSIHVK